MDLREETATGDDRMSFWSPRLGEQVAVDPQGWLDRAKGKIGLHLGEVAVASVRRAALRTACVLLSAGIVHAVEIRVPGTPAALATRYHLAYDGDNEDLVYRFIEYLTADSDLSKKDASAAPRRKNLSEQLDALNDLRTRMRDLDRKYGAGPLNLSTHLQKTEGVLKFLGYGKIKERELEPGDGRDEQVRRELLRWAGFDLEEFLAKLQAGGDAEVQVPQFEVSIPLDEATWRSEIFQRPDLQADHFFQQLVNDVRADMTYLLLSRVDERTRDFIRRQIGLRKVYGDFDLLWGLYNFSDALSVDEYDGKEAIRVPGAPSGSEYAQARLRLTKDPSDAAARQAVDLLGTTVKAWESLYEEKVDNPGVFLRRIFGDGRRAYFYAVMGEQPTNKLEALLTLRGAGSAATSRLRRLWDTCRVPYPDAYDSKRMAWRKLWDFRDLIAVVRVENGSIRLLGSPAAWRMALSDSDPIEDEEGVEKLKRKYAEQGSETAGAIPADPFEGLVEIAQDLKESRSDILLSHSKSPVEKFAAIQSIFSGDPGAVGNLSLPALYRNFDRHGVAYRLLDGVPLGGSEERVLRFLLQMHRLDRIGDRDLRNVSIQIFQSLLRMLQIEALNRSAPPGAILALFDRITMTPINTDRGFGRSAIDLTRELCALSPAEEGESEQDALIGTVTGAGREPVDVPIERAGEGTQYYRYHARRLAIDTADDFFREQDLTPLDGLLKIAEAIDAAKRDALASQGHPAEQVQAVADEIKTLMRAVSELRLPDTPAHRGLFQRFEIDTADTPIQELKKWEDVERDLLVRGRVTRKRELVEKCARLRKEVESVRQDLSAAGSRPADAKEQLDKLARSIDETSVAVFTGSTRFLADSLLGCLYARCADPRFAVREGLVRAHSFERPDLASADDNPWVEGRKVDLRWIAPNWTEKAVMVGSVDQVDYWMRSYCLGRTLQAGASASQMNMRLAAQFSAMEHLPAWSRVDGAALRYVAEVHGAAIAAIRRAPFDPALSNDLLQGTRDILSRRRLIRAAQHLSTGQLEPLLADMTPSETYLLGLYLLERWRSGHAMWSQSEDLTGTLTAAAADGDRPGMPACVEQAAGVPMVRTYGSLALRADPQPSYERFMVDVSGERLIERIDPRVLICVRMSAMGLPAGLLPLVQSGVFDRILASAKQLYVNDWSSVERTAKEVTTEEAIREILSAATTGSTPLLSEE